MATGGTKPFDIFLLDVGTTKFGDAVVCRINGKVIWVDAGHPGDLQLLSGQLGAIFPGAPPYPIDLLVLTHCHLDHIGCLPELLEEGILDVKSALVADEKLGFPLKAGFGQDLAGDSAAAQGALDLVLAGLREEAPEIASDWELASFLSDAATQYSRYLKALAFLDHSGIEVVRYGRDPEALRTLSQRIAPWGVTVLGPTLEHLLLCSEELLRLQTKAAHDLAGAFRSDAAPSAVELFRRVLTESSRPGGPAADALAALPFLADREGAGACLNNHSIVLKLEAHGQRAVLSGDQQFAAPEVPGLAASMRNLVEAVRQNGPYAFWKTSHHTSYNGVDEDVLRAVGARILAHSGGLHDPTHPDPSVLDLLAAFQPPLTWARTERNGLIRASLTKKGVDLTVSRGTLNDGRRNPKAPARDLEMRALAGRPTPAAAGGEAMRLLEPPGPPRAEPALPARPLDGGPVEVVTRVSQSGVRVHVTIEVENVAAGAAVTARGEETSLFGFRLAQGRPLDKLLFVTEPARLSQKIGAAAVREILDVCRRSGHAVALLAAPSTAEVAAAAVRPSLRDVAGVVLLGGFDVVPSGRIQVISDEEIEQLDRLREPFRDLPDKFCVWSDDAYADQDGDGIAELPVSRIPDGGSADFLRTALDATRPARPGSRAGLYNILRPFAKGVFSLIPGSEAILSSGPTRARKLPKGAVRRDAVYFMLHGSAEEPHLFDGEFSDDGASFWTEPAFHVSDVEASPGTVVFCGCCYGALSASPIASQFVSPAGLHPFAPSSSIALQFLAAGANAFVGSTAVHFSPPEETPELVGGRLHRSFWEHVAAGDPPARALHEARKSYVLGIPQLDEAEADLRAGKDTRIVLHAAERKIYQMFSCLGLGW